jgi:hypothetical protein
MGILFAAPPIGIFFFQKDNPNERGLNGGASVQFRFFTVRAVGDYFFALRVLYDNSPCRMFKNRRC